ncbi:LysR family transcriptional regulator [Ostreiculturibacter nitratireducens]|uniref:LysR family transcriptional regulator n=1 Tax=Ostreiculturibacter nitratireducens TaxID=3075226 RepID=UPI0031B63BEB
MDWRAVTFDWNRARAFLVTAEEGSLSAAARALGMTQPTLGRQVAALEEELGVALFERAGRGLELTPGGVELLEHARAMGEAAGRISLAASGQSRSVEGIVTVAASEAVAAFLLPGIVAKLRAQAPGIVVEVIASNATQDLRRREADIAVRSFRPTQPGLIARKLRDVKARLYASDAYLERLGEPKGPEDLSRAEFIGFDTTDALIRALNGLGLELGPENFPILSENHLVQWEMVKGGLGIGVMPEEIGEAEPSVRQVLAALRPIVVPMWLVSHRELATSRRVRLVFDLLAEALL